MEWKECWVEDNRGYRVAGEPLNASAVVLMPGSRFATFDAYAVLTIDDHGPSAEDFTNESWKLIKEGISGEEEAQAAVKEAKKYVEEHFRTLLRVYLEELKEYYERLQKRYEKRIARLEAGLETGENKNELGDGIEVLDAHFEGKDGKERFDPCERL